MRLATDNVIIGLAVGDMVGAPFEFLTPETIRQRFPLMILPAVRTTCTFKPGEFTDDTEMALSILGGYAKVSKAPGAFRVGHLLKHTLALFHAWLSAGPRDVGCLTRSALGRASGLGPEAWLKSGCSSCGNGGVMRAAATIAAGVSTQARIIDDAILLSSLTHADPRSLFACAALCLGLRALIEKPGENYADVWCEAVEPLRHLYGANLTDILHVVWRDEGYLKKAGDASHAALIEVLGAVQDGAMGKSGGNSGYAVSTLQTAICYGWQATFEEGIRNVVREGDDADTVAAVCGSIMGAQGKMPPEAWLTGLRCGERWPVWPDEVVGEAAVARLLKLAADARA